MITGENTDDFERSKEVNKPRGKKYPEVKLAVTNRFRAVERGQKEPTAYK